MSRDIEINCSKSRQIITYLPITINSMKMNQIQLDYFFFIFRRLGQSLLGLFLRIFPLRD